MAILLTACAQPQPINTTARGTRTTLSPQQSPGGIVNPPALATTPRSPFATRSVATASPAPEATHIAPEPTQIQTTSEVLPSATPEPQPSPVPPTLTALPTPEVIIVPAQQPTATSEERWRAQQKDREVVQPPRLYNVEMPATLQWYDPLTGQVLEIGTVRGVIPAQALFVFRPSNEAAIEVPYRINNDFGLTSISSVLVERMHQAGYQESVEAFVVLNESVVPVQ